MTDTELQPQDPGAASTEGAFYDTRHPYTLGLLASLPRADEEGGDLRLRPIAGHPPSLVNRPSGCAFHPRCEFRRLPEPCATEVPAARPMENAEHLSACHFAHELKDVDVETLRAEEEASA